jgi:[ribosomal protein S18]-alanine N-acetyltransferase
MQGPDVMQFVFAPMTQDYPQAIVGWHYEAPYSFYDMDADADDLREFLDAASWPETYFAALDERGDLVGFFSFKKEAYVLEIGLGLRPDLTGQGIGLAFVQAGLAFARERFAHRSFRLRVATFNQRAIRVYERAGFRPTRTFVQDTNGASCEFLEMVRIA